MFSVIIPCYNELDALAKTLAGFAAQRDLDGMPFEVVLVDNNSWKHSPDSVYRRFVRHLPLTLIRQPVLAHTFALCGARNLGMRIARHPWIVTMDADCVPNPLYLANLRDFIHEQSQATASDLMITGERIFIAGRAVTPEAILQDPEALDRVPETASASNYGQVRDRRFPDLLSLSASPHPWAFFHGGNSVFSRRRARKIGGYDEAYDGRWGYEDIDFAYRMLREGGCRPEYTSGLHVYHLERSADTIERADRRENPNWRRIASRIPGFAEFKAQQFERLGIETLQ